MAIPGDFDGWTDGLCFPFLEWKVHELYSYSGCADGIADNAGTVLLLDETGSFVAFLIEGG